jgi:hypothetical protein
MSKEYSLLKIVSHYVFISTLFTVCTSYFDKYKLCDLSTECIYVFCPQIVHIQYHRYLYPSHVKTIVEI